MRYDLLKSLPQVSKLLERYKEKYPEAYLKEAIRDTLSRVRQEVKEGRRSSLKDLEILIEAEVKRRINTKLRKVINATGVVINTNLGRAPISDSAAEFVKDIAKSYSNLEYNLLEGKRGSRSEIVEDYLKRLTGCESAFVVNNNAAAVFLVLNTIAKGREVIVSRGELVEIGGGFRIPDIMRESGAKLVEVGTTNKTKLSDYEKAITENTSLIMKVHRSNFYMEGFVEDVKPEELLKFGIPVYYDAGSGLVIDLRRFGINSDEPDIRSYISRGISVISGSGDKLLGGPQAGIIVGKKELVEAMKKNPLSRILRVDKMTLAALEMTLRLYIEERYTQIPIVRMLTYEPWELKKKAKRLMNLLKKIQSLEVKVLKEFSKCGGGSLPQLTLETYCVALKHKNFSVQEIERRLRSLETPIICRVKDDCILLDVRTIFEYELPLIPSLVDKALT